MNQKEKCSPKPASINNDFYSWVPPTVSFIFRKDGMGITESLQRWGSGTNKEARAGEIGEEVPEPAAVGSGACLVETARWGSLLCSPCSRGNMCQLIQLSTFPTASEG